VDAPRDRATEPDRVNEIRREIEGIRSRIAVAADALVYKADVPSRLADLLSATASSFTARVLRRPPVSTPDIETDRTATTSPEPTEMSGVIGSTNASS